MNDHQTTDSFHENLQAMGRAACPPPRLDPAVRARCLNALENGSSAAPALVRMKRPALFSALGLAASIAIVVGLILPGGNGRDVKAAVILAKLNEQISASRTIDVRLSRVAIDEVTVDGFVQLAANGVAGDLDVAVADSDGLIRADLAFGLGPGNAWVLVRQLQIPDPDVALILPLIFPPGSETLLLLPPDAIEAQFELDLEDAFEAFSSGEVAAAIEGIIASRADVGATVTTQADGTVLLMIPFSDSEVFETLGAIVKDSVGQATGTSREAQVEIEVGGQAGGRGHGVRIGHQVEVRREAPATQEADGDELLGSTLIVVYDPAAELVRSVHLENFGRDRGTISVTLGEGEVDPALFDPAAVTTPNTRTLDLTILEALLKQYQQQDGQ